MRLSLAVLCLCAVALAQTCVPSEEEMRGLQRVVAEIRGLDFEEDVPLEAMTFAQFASRARTQVAFSLEGDAGVARRRAYVALGLYPDDIDEAGEQLRLVQAAGIAFYAPAPLRTMYVVDRGGARERNMRLMMIDMLLSLLGSRWELVLTAHELAHALQDQHFPGSLSPKGNDDQVLAMRALFEGDANLVTYEYLARLGKRSAEDLLSANAGLAFDHGAWMGLYEVDTAPRYMRESYLMPYTSGVGFVRALRARGGWAAVDEAYAHPPTSTEQVLHPEKYLGERDVPQEVRIPDLSESFPDTELVREETLGEFGLRVLVHELEGEFLEAVHGTACEGWDGDRYRVLESKVNGSRVLIWASTWDSDEDAAEFFLRYRISLLRKYAQPPGWGTTDGDRKFVGLVEDVGLVVMRREGREVLVLEGLDADQESLAEVIQKAMAEAVEKPK